MPISSIKTVTFDAPASAARSCASAWARMPDMPGWEERLLLKERARQLLKERGAVLVAHYYVDGSLGRH